MEVVVPDSWMVSSGISRRSSQILLNDENPASGGTVKSYMCKVRLWPSMKSITDQAHITDVASIQQNGG